MEIRVKIQDDEGNIAKIDGRDFEFIVNEIALRTLITIIFDNGYNVLLKAVSLDGDH